MADDPSLHTPDEDPWHWRRLPTLVACRPVPVHVDGRRVKSTSGPYQLFRYGPEDVGTRLQLYKARASELATGEGDRQPYVPSAPLRAPTWCAHSRAVYMCEGSAVVRLDADGTVTVVAGRLTDTRRVDGQGSAARFSLIKGLAVDGAGVVYVADRKQIRKLVLKTLPDECEAMVSTLPLKVAAQIACMVVDTSAGGGDLIYATSTAVFKWPLGGAAGSPAKRLAGSQQGKGNHGSCFTCISGLVLDGEGGALVVDRRSGGTAIHRVAPDGRVTTVAEGLSGEWLWPSILPGGRLVLCSFLQQVALQAVDLNGTAPHALAAAPALPAAPVAPATPAAASAPAADVTILAGGRTFRAHSSTLISGSAYFRLHLSGSAAQQLDLGPDADADAFALVLLFFYTGAVDVPAALARQVAELADVLQLPALCSEAQAGVRAGVSVGTVVGLLLWAEARGPAFSELLARLKRWHVRHHEAVVEQAPDSLEQLAARSPKMMAELVIDATRRAKRARTRLAEAEAQ